MKVKAKEAITIKLTPAEAVEFLKNINSYGGILYDIKQELQNQGIVAQQ